MTTAFVLTGGGSLGAVQVGMLAALLEQGIRPDLLVGTSVGAVNAAYLAGAEAADGLSRLLECHLGYDALEDARLPVEVTATDLVTGVGRVLDAGPSAPAVRASAAVPGILPPVSIDGSTYVDGAIGDLDVLGHTAAHDVSDIYLLPAGYPCAGGPPRSALGVALTSLSLLLHRGLVAQVRAYAGATQQPAAREGAVS